jgi:hypothetical protein
MSQSVPLASVLNKYMAETTNLQTKLQQDRSLHMSHLVNAYMEAALSGGSDEFLTMIEEMISKRKKFNSRKKLLDASEWLKVDNRLKHLLKENTGVLSGGALGIENRSKERDMMHAARLQNAYTWNMMRKLHHDRKVQKKELENVLSEATLHTSPEYVLMLKNLVNDVEKYNVRKSALDAEEWRNLEGLVLDNLAPLTAISILKCGAPHSADLTAALETKEESSSDSDDYYSDYYSDHDSDHDSDDDSDHDSDKSAYQNEKSNEMRFRSEAAAQLWDMMNSSTFN